jgi:hypothetical protein
MAAVTDIYKTTGTGLHGKLTKNAQCAAAGETQSRR